MAHKKAIGSRAIQKGKRRGKRRGVKHFAGEIVKAGTILVRQVGTVFHPGENVGLGRDFTIFSKIKGKVYFKNLSKKKKAIGVKPV